MPTPFDLGLVDGNVWSAAHVNSIEAIINALKDITDADHVAALSARYQSITGGVLLTDTAQSIATATFTDITWTDAEVSDPDGWIAGGIATLTVPAGKGGRYIVSYNGTWSALPGAVAGVTCVTTGGGSYQSGATNSLTTDYANALTFVRTLAAGNTIKFQAYQNSGSARNLNSRLEIAPA